MRFFYKKNWKKYRLAAILLNLFMGVIVSAGTENGSSSASGGVTVRVRPLDAEGTGTREEALREAAELRESVRRLQLENQTLKAERSVQHWELLELTAKYLEQNESLRQTQLVLAGAYGQMGVRKSDGREDQLIQTLAYVSSRGGDLALQTVQFCEFVNALLPELPIGYLKRAELKLKLEQARKSADEFTALTSAKDPDVRLRKCRILAVDRAAKCVVLSAGAVHGAFHGMLYHVGKQATLRVVDVRPFVTAATLVSGNIEDLAPAMEAVSERVE